MARGKRGSGKDSGWYRAVSRTFGRVRRWTPSGLVVALIQLVVSSRWIALRAHAGQTRVWCGWPVRSATVHWSPSGCWRSRSRRSSVPVTMTWPGDSVLNVPRQHPRLVGRPVLDLLPGSAARGGKQGQLRRIGARHDVPSAGCSSTNTSPLASSCACTRAMISRAADSCSSVGI